MNTDILNDVNEFANEVVANYDAMDTRPSWLRELPGAVHPGEQYYLFLYLMLSKFRESAACLEIGTRGGTAAFHMAYATKNNGGFVTTVDIDPSCVVNVGIIASAHGIENICALAGDSTRMSLSGECDVLFIDGDHTLRSSYGDYLQYRQLVRDGGFIFFDDTRLNPGMTAAWNAIADPKIEMPQLHYMGFGMAIKSNYVRPPSLDEVVAKNAK